MWALVAFLVGCSALAVAQDDRCLNCICQVESGCSAVGCVWDQGSLSCGPYQIKEPYWIDCGQPGGGWQQCANDFNCARGCVLSYMQRYGPSCTGQSWLSCEQAARIHNGGPNGCNDPNTLPYWERVHACYGNGYYRKGYYGKSYYGKGNYGKGYYGKARKGYYGKGYGKSM
jgi:hypothetical protein